MYVCTKKCNMCEDCTFSYAPQSLFAMISFLYPCLFTRSATHKTHHPVKKSGSAVKCFLRKSSYKFKMSTFLPQQRWWHQPSRSSISWLSRIFRTSNSTDMSSKHSGTKAWERDVLKDALNEEKFSERLTPSEICEKIHDNSGDDKCFRVERGLFGIFTS